jgi:DNA gyrase/topoisomerase IV subunit B
VTAVIKEQVNIVPHVNILLRGGEEYDFQHALAELIDNSIQNTMNSKERRVEIQFSAPTPKNGLEKHCLTIWDNGSGMNLDGIKNWATLGVSTPPIVTKLKSVEKYLTSDFSRYGVGSKKAIFNLLASVIAFDWPGVIRTNHWHVQKQDDSRSHGQVHLFLSF